MASVDPLLSAASQSRHQHQYPQQRPQQQDISNEEQRPQRTRKKSVKRVSDMSVVDEVETRRAFSDIGNRTSGEQDSDAVLKPINGSVIGNKPSVCHQQAKLSEGNAHPNGNPVDWPVYTRAAAPSQSIVPTTASQSHGVWHASQQIQQSQWSSQSSRQPTGPSLHGGMQPYQSHHANQVHLPFPQAQPSYHASAPTLQLHHNGNRLVLNASQQYYPHTHQTRSVHDVTALVGEVSAMESECDTQISAPQQNETKGFEEYDTDTEVEGKEALLDEDIELESNSDCIDEADPVSLYDDDIYTNFLRSEVKFACDPNYMERQKDITNDMRSILLDWLIEVAEEYSLKLQTLYLTFNYIDRFLTKIPVSRSKLQLVGVACMLVASKYEEIHPPTVDDFVYISDRTYLTDEVVKMERTVLQVLNFSLTVATSHDFYRRFSEAAHLSRRNKFLGAYLMERFSMEPMYLRFRPSIIAASAVSLAMITVSEAPWNDSLQQLTRFRFEDLRECIAAMHSMHMRPRSDSCKLKAAQEKYKNAKYCKVSTIPPCTIDWNK